MQHTAIDTKIVNSSAVFNEGGGIRGFWSGDHEEHPIGRVLTGWAPQANVEDLPKTIPPSIGAY